MRKVIKRRPESNRHGDERGNVWYHKYAWLDRAFDRAPKLKQKEIWSTPEISETRKAA